MIEFNLLPDVKLKFVRTRRVKRLVVLTSVLIAGVTFAIFLFLLVFVDILQHKNVNDLGHNITSADSRLQSIPDLNKVLTVQNQLQSLPALYEQRPVASRLFGYMAAITPAQATISNLSIDFTKHTLSIMGNADTLPTVNQYIDTLKFTTYSLDKSTATAPVFSGVVLSAFGVSPKQTSYTISASFDPTIFSGVHTVQLVVPKVTTTRSVIDQPTSLFKSATP